MEDNFTHKILIVDDEILAREHVADMIASIIPEAELTKSGDPLSALSLILTNHYDLVFVDVEMPLMNGIELLHEIHKTGKKPYLIIVSAYDKFEYAQRGMEAGASAYILKPIDKEHLQSVINKYMEIRKLNNPQKIIVFNKGDGHFPVRIDDIIAIEKTGKNFMTVYKRDSCIRNVRGILNKISEQLPGHFTYINRHCIVNTKEISNFNRKANEISMFCNGQETRFLSSRNGIKEFMLKLDHNA